MLNKRYLSMAFSIVTICFAINSVCMIILYLGGFEIHYNDGLSINQYVCTRSSFETDGWARNSIAVIVYLPFVMCNSTLEPFVIIFNYLLLISSFYLLFSFAKINITASSLALLTMGSLFLCYSAFYPSKELLVFTSAVLFVSKGKFIFLMFGALIRPSLASLILLKFSFYRKYPVFVFGIFYATYVLLLENLSYFAFTQIYFSKLAEMYADPSVGLTVYSQLYKLPVTFGGYRHFFESLTAYNLVSILSQIMLIFCLCSFLISKSKIHRAVFICIMIYGFSYPMAHARFFLTFIPLFLAFAPYQTKLNIRKEAVV